jgi:hypothetical protein
MDFKHLKQRDPSARGNYKINESRMTNEKSFASRSSLVIDRPSSILTQKVENGSY